MKTLTCHGNKFKEGELIRPFQAIAKQAQSVSFWYTMTMPKQTEKAESTTALDVALRRMDDSNAEAQFHLKNVYSVGELSREATTEDFSVVRKEGARQVRRNVACYNRFIIVGGKDVFWTGASFKDAGRLTFAAAKMGADEYKICA